MLRYILGLVILVGLVALVTRARGPRRVLWVILGLVIVYAILKLTGVIEDISPSRMEVL